MSLQLVRIFRAPRCTGSRGVTFVRKNYPSYILPCKIHNLVIMINKFAQCNLCKSNVNGFLLVPFSAVFLDLDLCAGLVRHIVPHIEICYELQTILPQSPNTLSEGQRLFVERGTKCRVKIRTREETYTTCSRSMCTAAHGDGSDRYRKQKRRSFKNGEFALEEESSVTRKPA